MSTLAPSVSKTKLLSNYPKLRDAVRKTLLLGRQKIEREKVFTYWKTGKLINDHLFAHKDRADYGEYVIAELSKDLSVNRTVLHRVVKFAQQFPIVADRQQLTWTHYRALITIPDEKKRLELADRASRLKWTSTQLEEKIKRDFGREHASVEAPSVKKDISFKPKRGTVGAYRVSFSEGLLLDLGFSSFIEHPALKSGRFKEGDIVQTVIASPWHRRSGDKDEAISVLKDAATANLYTYQAEVEKVVDADTLWLWIGLGFDLWVRQKVRLRGIDAPELDTKAGFAAKRFVESRLEPIKEIIVTTTKPDKYDRYLSDVWIGDANLNQLLLSTGRARLLRQLPDTLWDESNWGRF